ncbi:hypothetical protein [Umezawaea beigongshangensis]|uniref:hypothetical protein n=1 Tax=Umezawaea beigongshangensis TaxID=2780383 RepID=UPI0018F1D9E2|nr:hypothetical protein [Umezawaea beigongshangensis]
MSSSYEEQQDLTETPIENFIGFVSFLAKNDLWDEAKQALESAGIGSIHVSTAPVQVIRRLITDELLGNDRLSGSSRKHAQVIAECGCGVTNPGLPPGGQPQFPHGGGDAGADGGHPVVQAPDGG